MDPLVCREHLGKLLADEAACLAQLDELLQKEHQLLLANDIDGLEQATDKRQAAIGALLRVDDERRSLCRMHGQEPDAAGLERLLNWCDPKGTLQAQWADCAARAARCRELNDRNGALVTARMQRVEHLLAVITRPAESAAAYGPHGVQSAPSSGRMLSAEV